LNSFDYLLANFAHMSVIAPKSVCVRRHSDTVRRLIITWRDVSIGGPLDYDRSGRRRFNPLLSNYFDYVLLLLESPQSRRTNHFCNILADREFSTGCYLFTVSNSCLFFYTKRVSITPSQPRPPSPTTLWF